MLLIPVGRLFLHMHDIKFGDTVGEPQSLVAHIHEITKGTEGFMVSTDGLCFSIIRPISSLIQHIGALECGTSLLQLLDFFEKRIVAPVIFYFLQEMLSQESHFRSTSQKPYRDHCLATHNNPIFNLLPETLLFVAGAQRSMINGRIGIFHSYLKFIDFQGISSLLKGKLAFF